MSVMDRARAVLTKPATVAEATAEVERLASIERSWATAAQAKLAALAELEPRTGDAILDAELLDGSGAATQRELAQTIATLRAEIETAHLTSDAARRRRASAIPLIWAAEADELRAQAAELRKQADSREPKTQKMLDELAEWEQCPYVPSPEPLQPHAHGMVGTYGNPNVVIVPTPRTRMLRNSAALLERQADAKERQAVPAGGGVNAVGAEDLVSQVYADACRLAPTLRELLAWIESATTTELARRSRIQRGQTGHVGAETPIAFSVVWTGGSIRASESRAGVPA